MNPEKNNARLTGAAFLIVIVTSLLSGTLLPLSGTVSDMLVTISNHPALMQTSILFGMLTSAGIIVLAVLLYSILNHHNKVIALIALGWWLAEGILLAVSKIGDFALIPLSQEFVKAGVPGPSFYQTLGSFLYYGLDQTGSQMHMFFYGLGGILWFYLFLKARNIPSIIAIWGMVAEAVALVGGLLVWFSVPVNFFFFAQIGILELAIGLWLVIKGTREANLVGFRAENVIRR